MAREGKEPRGSAAAPAPVSRGPALPALARELGGSVDLATHVLDECDGTLDPRGKLKTVLSGLRRSSELRAAVAAGEITPRGLVAMPPEELATPAVRERDRIAVKRAAAAASLSTDALAICREKKTGGTKTEWFGGDDDDDGVPAGAPPGSASHMPAALAGGRDGGSDDGSSDEGEGGDARSRSAAPGTDQPPARKRPGSQMTETADALSPLPRDETVNGVYVSKRLRGGDDAVPSAAAQIALLAATRRRSASASVRRESGHAPRPPLPGRPPPPSEDAPRVSSASEALANAKQRAAVASRVVLDGALADARARGDPALPREAYKSVLRAAVHDVVRGAADVDDSAAVARVVAARLADAGESGRSK